MKAGFGMDYVFCHCCFMICRVSVCSIVLTGFYLGIGEFEVNMKQVLKKYRDKIKRVLPETWMLIGSDVQYFGF